MKIKANILIILIVIVVLLGVVLALAFIPEESTDNPNDQTIEKNIVEVLNIDADLTTYTHTAGDDVYRLDYLDGKWNVADNENVELDNSAVSGMLSVISKLSTDTVVAENETDMAKYGIENPSDIIEIMDVNGAVYTVKIGSQTATQSGYYAVVNDETKIFILSVEDYNILCGGLDSLRNKEVVSIRGNVYSFTITNSETSMTIQPKTTNNVNASSFSKWEMVTPYHKDVNEYIFEENVINSLNFTVLDFVDDKPLDYSTYGLSNPEYIIEIVTTSGSHKILLGNTIDGDKIYMKTADAPNVYSISTDSVKYRDYTPVYLLDSLVFSRNITAVESITFKSDKLYELKIDGSNFRLNNKKVDEEKFRETYLTFISSVISGEIQKENVGKEICRFTFDYNTDTSAETVVFYEYGDMYSAVSVNGITEFYIKLSYVEDMIKAVNNLTE